MVILAKQNGKEIYERISWLSGDTRKIIPARPKVLRAFSYFQPAETKVIIIGQDPYPNAKDACGLAFSVEHEDYPPSLKNVFKSLQNDLGFTMPKTGNLEPWAKQGVLLLNSILTTNEGFSFSHEKMGWEQYTSRAIQKVIDCGQPLVIICWGKYAEHKMQNLDLSRNKHVLNIVGGHPSPTNTKRDFFGIRYFSQANTWLAMHGIKPIDWKL